MGLPLRRGDPGIRPVSEQEHHASYEDILYLKNKGRGHGGSGHAAQTMPIQKILTAL